MSTSQAPRPPAVSSLLSATTRTSPAPRPLAVSSWAAAGACSKRRAHARAPSEAHSRPQRRRRSAVSAGIATAALHLLRPPLAAHNIGCTCFSHRTCCTHHRLHLLRAPLALRRLGTLWASARRTHPTRPAPALHLLGMLSTSPRHAQRMLPAPALRLVGAPWTAALHRNPVTGAHDGNAAATVAAGACRKHVGGVRDSAVATAISDVSEKHATPHR
mmetsp:Transcript_35417/g.104747  ORF Transcript_35417/g.104747 Transcript_35417/m.104747 type:complete len:217 (-) Transcript_35417:129-779(-)